MRPVRLFDGPARLEFLHHRFDVHNGRTSDGIKATHCQSRAINFQNFTTAHGPFELTAIVLSAGAGLKIGLGWIVTNGLNRRDSLVKSAREALPIAMCAVILFCMAAVIEGFISPTESARMGWWFKGLVGLVSNFMLLLYFVILGFPDHFVNKTELL